MSTDPLLLLDAAFASYPESSVPRGYIYSQRAIENVDGLYVDVYRRGETNDYIVSFRGTEPGSLADITTNANLGWLQFAASRPKIRSLLHELLSKGGNVDVTGHSLGGALAQFAVYDVVKNAGETKTPTAKLRLTTWNALGGEWALRRMQEYQPSIADQIEARHYYRGDDLVARLGVGHVGGVSLRLSDPAGRIEGLLAAHMKEELQQSLQAGKIQQVRPNYFQINDQSQQAVGKMLLGAHNMVNISNEDEKKLAIDLMISGAVDAFRNGFAVQYDMSRLLANIVMQQYVVYLQNAVRDELTSAKTMVYLMDQLGRHVLLPAGASLRDVSVEITRSMLEYTRESLLSERAPYFRDVRLALAVGRGLRTIGANSMELQTSIGFWQIALELHRLQNIPLTLVQDRLVQSLDSLLAGDRRRSLLKLAEVMVEVDKRCGGESGPISGPVSVFSGLLIRGLLAGNDAIQANREQQQRDRQELLDGLQQKILPASLALTRELIEGMSRNILEDWQDFAARGLDQAREVGSLLLNFCYSLADLARNKGDLIISNFYWQLHLVITSIPGFVHNPIQALQFSGSLGMRPFHQDLISLINRPTHLSPLVLDINGNGITTLGLNLRRFDLNADGVLEYCGWLNGQDGFLALDRNGNGSIDSGAELFGDYTILADGRRAQNGFAALAELDANGDGLVDDRDPLWHQLLLWRDANGNAISEYYEIGTVASFRIAALELSYRPGRGTDANGNDRRLEGHFRRTDGRRSSMEDIWFATMQDPLIPTWLPLPPNPAQIPAQKGFIDLVGIGRLPSLGQAIQADQSGELLKLLALWRQASGEDRRLLVRFIVLSWSGVRHDLQLPFYQLVDHRMLMALDAMGVRSSDDRDSSREHMLPRFIAVFEEMCSIVGHLLEAEERLSPLWSEAIRRDSATGRAVLDAAGFERALQAQLQRCKNDDDLIATGRILRSFTDLGPLLMEALHTRAVRESGPRKRELWLMLMQRIDYAQFSEQFRWSNHVAGMEVGNADANLLTAGVGDDVLMGLEGDDTISESNGNDTIIGGPGNDLIYESEGRNGILFYAGDGCDTLYLSYSLSQGNSADHFNTIVFDSSFSPQRLRVVFVEGALFLTFAGSGDKICLDYILPTEQLISIFNSLLQLQFADGTLISFREIIRRAFVGGDENDVLHGSPIEDTLVGGAGEDELLGHRGDDWLQGGIGHDKLSGGEGNDTLQGGSGNDHLYPWLGNNTILFGLGDGSDQMFGVGSQAQHQLQLGAGITPSSLVARRQQENLVITLLASGESITLMQFFSEYTNPSNTIESYSLRFADGTVWDHNRLISSCVLGSAAADRLLGTPFADTMRGEAGNDQLDGGGGHDVLLGGDGDDLLIAGEGPDSLDGGSGNDTLIALGDDILQAGSGVNRIEFQRGQPILLAHPPEAGLSQNTVVLPAGMTSSNVQFMRHGKMLLISGAHGVFRVQDFYRDGRWNSSAAPLHFLRFPDGKQWDARLIDASVRNSFVGNANNNRIRGSAADDWLDGLGGNDVLLGGAGNDVLDGGPGVDTGSWADQTSGVRADLSLDRAQSSAAGVDTLISMENLLGGSGPDQLLGNDQANFLDGGAGDDWLDGGGGDDTVVGGTGVDTLSYGRSPAGVRVSLDQARAQNTLASGFDLITGIEHLSGSAFGDLLQGNAVANRLEGGGGNDTLRGGGGADRLIGGVGADEFVVASHSETGVLPGQRDLLLDFEPIDCLDLSAIDANDLINGNQAFVWIGAAAFSALGQLRYTLLPQGNGLLEGNCRGSLLADFQLEFQGGPSLTAASVRL